MRLERVSTNQIEIHVTFDELAKCGLSKEDVEKSTSKWHELLSEILEEANNKWNVNMEGTMIVDVFAMQSNSMIVLVTFHDADDFFIETEDDFYIEMVEFSVTDEKDLFYKFFDLEDVIQFSTRIHSYFAEGTLYFYQNHYYLWIPYISEKNKWLSALISEYGNRSGQSFVVVQEYGKVIFQEAAIKNLIQYFTEMG